MPGQGRRRGLSETQAPYSFSEGEAEPFQFDPTGFQDRLRQAIEPLTVNAFAKKSELITESHLRNYLSGALPRLDKAAAICATAKVSLDWLATGRAHAEPLHEKDTGDAAKAAELAQASQDMMSLMLDVVEGLGQHLEERGVTRMAPPHKHRMLVELIAREMMARKKGDEDEHKTNVVDIADFRKLVDLLAVGE